MAISNCDMPCETMMTKNDSFRPRFSLRTLAILVTLACAYFGAWEATSNCLSSRV